MTIRRLMRSAAVATGRLALAAYLALWGAYAVAWRVPGAGPPAALSGAGTWLAGLVLAGCSIADISRSKS